MRLHTGVYGHRKRVCTESDSERKIPCRTGESNLRQRLAPPIKFLRKSSLVYKVQGGGGTAKRTENQQSMSPCLNPDVNSKLVFCLFVFLLPTKEEDALDARILHVHKHSHTTHTLSKQQEHTSKSRNHYGVTREYFS